MITNLEWSQLKIILPTSSLTLHYIEYSDKYRITAYNSTIPLIECDLYKIHEDCLDFETNFKSLCNKPLTSKSYPFSDTGGFRFRGASFIGSVPSNTTQDLDFLVVQERWINGGRAIVNNIGPEDKLTFQIVDKDNVIGLGAGTVLDEFICEYYVPTNGSLEVSLAYPARIPAGLYIRLKYTSTHASGCTVKCNLYLHWKSV